MLFRVLWALGLALACVPLRNATVAPLQVVHDALTWVASWYGPGFEGRPMASLLTFWPELPVVAHRTLPLGTLLRIRRGARVVNAIVLDRGPFIDGRDLDLSASLAARLGMLRDGVGEVIVEVTGHEPRARWPDALLALQS